MHFLWPIEAINGSQMIADPLARRGQGKRLQKACTGNSAASGRSACWSCCQSCRSVGLWQEFELERFWCPIRRYDGARYASPHRLCIHCWLLADVRLAGHLGWHAVDASIIIHYYITHDCLAGILIHRSQPGNSWLKLLAQQLDYYQVKSCF